MIKTSPSSPISMSAMRQSLTEVSYDMICRGHKWASLAERINHDAYVTTMEKQASAQKNIWPLAFKACGIAFSALTVATLATPTSALLKITPEFLQAKAGTPEKLTEYLCNLFKPIEKLPDFMSVVTENQSNAHKTKLSANAELANMAKNQAQRRSADYNSDNERMLNNLQTGGDAQRATLAQMTHTQP